MKSTRQIDLARLLDRPELTGCLKTVDELMQAQIPNLFQDFLKPRLRAGKKLRPALLLAITPRIGDKALKMATAVELVHKASLLHDTLIDERLDAGDVRRYLLAGDYLLAAGLRLAASQDRHLAAEMALTIQQMAEGQAQQLSKAYVNDAADKIYQAVITQKTASLFAFSCRAGAKIAGFDNQRLKACERYGLNFGRAFQIIDDLIDGEFDTDRRPTALVEAKRYLRLAQKQALVENLAGLPGYYLTKIVPDI